MENQNQYGIEFTYDKPVRLTVYTYGEVVTHIHPTATGYRIVDGYLAIFSGNKLVSAVYDRNQWISVRE